MAFFVDANVIVYSAAAGPMGDSCRSILRPIADGEVDGVTSTAVLEEVWHVELSGRAGSIVGLAQNAYAIFTPLLAVDDRILARAFGVRVQGLGANDRVHTATCLENGIDTIVTADSAFDGIRALHRIDPLDGKAVGKLLAS